jgi:photosystem II stability/assembly factor-like uncharacterized protein
VPANTGLSGGNVAAIAIDPSKTTNVYVGTGETNYGTGNGVYASTDKGATWTPLNLGIENVAINAIGVIPGTPATLCANAIYNGFFRSTDGGQTWAMIGPAISTFATHPSAPGVLITGTARSVDCGLTWTNSPADNPVAHAVAFAFDKTAQTAYMAGQNAGPYSPTVWKTTDGGKSWTDMLATKAAPATGALCANDGIIGIGADTTTTPSALWVACSQSLWRSVDGGASWSSVTLPAALAGLNSFVVLPPMPGFSTGTLYGSSGRGQLLRSQDAGATWTTVISLGGNGRFPAFAVDPTDAGSVYVGSNNPGIFRTNGGTSFALSTAGLQGFTGAVVQGPGAALYAPVNGPFKSTDGGATWSALGTGTPGIAMDSITVEPSTGTVYGTFPGNGFWKLPNGAGAWQKVGTAEPGNAIADPFTAGALYGWFNGYPSFGRSTDSGATWNTLINNLGSKGVVWGMYYGFAGPSTTLYAFVTTNASATPPSSYVIYRSTDFGATWQVLRSGPAVPANWVEGVFQNPNNANILYVTPHTNSLLKSTDGGATWTALQGPPMSQWITSFAIDPVNDSVLWAQTDYYNRALYRSTDGGLTWTQSTSGISKVSLSYGIVPSLTTSGTVWINTNHRGIFKTTTGGF